jgi:DNA repair protein RadD
MTHTLRDYQAQAVSEIQRLLFDEGKQRVLLVAPTGAGKTVMAAALVQDFVSRGLRVLFVAHRVELVEQAVAKLGVPCGVIVAGSPPGLGFMPCVVASLQTLVRREMPPCDVLVIDEAHHAMSASYRRVIDSLPDAMVVGLTATPTRLDSRGLAEIFSDMYEAARTSALIEQGSLVRPRVFSHPTQPDLSKVKITAGDYNEKQLDQACNQAKIRGDIVEHWLARAENRSSVLFAVSIAHSRALIDDFGRAGVVAVHVDGSMPRGERDRALAAIRSGEARILSNVGIVTEGWDFPELEVCVLARPTASISLLLQMWGRVMRPAPGKTEALVLDHAGNVLRHGMLPHQDVAWRSHFSGEKKKRGKKGKLGTSLAVKNCPSCYAVVVRHAERCQECGYQWEVEETAVATDKNTQLVEITDMVLELVRQHSSKPAYKPGIVERLEREGVRFYIGAGGALKYDDPTGAVRGMLIHEVQRQSKQIAAYVRASKPTDYKAKLLKRIEERKVSPEFLELVREHKGAFGTAAHAWKQRTGRWP